MQAILIPELSTPNVAIKIGDIVSNFGSVARIVGVHHAGDFILREVGGSMKWLAPAENCIPTDVR